MHRWLFGISLGAAVALSATYASVPMQEPIATRYWIVAIVSGVAAMYTGFLALQEWSDKRIRSQALQRREGSE